MINVKALRGLMAEQGMSGVAVAQELGITPKTFYAKMKKGVFGSDEMYKLIAILNIVEPAKIFFADK